MITIQRFKNSNFKLHNEILSMKDDLRKKEFRQNLQTKRLEQTNLTKQLKSMNIKYNIGAIEVPSESILENILSKRMLPIRSWMDTDGKFYKKVGNITYLVTSKRGVKKETIVV